MAEIQTPLRGATFETRPKQVLQVEPFLDHTGLARTPPYAGDFIELVRRIENGLELGHGFYRKRIGDTPDELLEVHGIKHLHLGGQNSNVLVFAAEYEDVVILLEINDHKHFATDPIGSLLVTLHRRKMEQQAEEAARPAAERRAQEERVADRRKRFAEMRKNGWKRPEPKG